MEGDILGFAVGYCHWRQESGYGAEGCFGVDGGSKYFEEEGWCLDSVYDILLYLCNGTNLSIVHARDFSRMQLGAYPVSRVQKYIFCQVQPHRALHNTANTKYTIS